MRGEGIEVYGTADAGPNVFAISRPEDAETVAARLVGFTKDNEAKILLPGPGAHLVDGAAE